MPELITAIADQAKAIKDALGQYKEVDEGDVVIAFSLADLWAKAQLQSNRNRMLIAFVGEQSEGSNESRNRLHRVERGWQVAVTRGRQLVEGRENSLAEETTEGKPLYTIVEEIREILRRVQGITAYPPIDFKSIRPMSFGNMIIDGYIIEFAISTDLVGMEFD